MGWRLLLSAQTDLEHHPASEDRTAHVSPFSDSKEIAILRGHRKEVTSVTFSPDGTRVASAADNNTALLRTVSETQPLVLQHADKVNYVAFNTEEGSPGSHVLE